MTTTTWDTQLQNERAKFGMELAKYHDVYSDDSILAELVDQVLKSAASRSLNAAYGGEHGDGGATMSIRELSGFLDGVLYAETGKLSGPYGEAIDAIKKTRDPEYKKYLELKEKFGA